MAYAPHALTPEAMARFTLARTPRVGPQTYRDLLARFGSAAEALAALPDLARHAGGKPLTAPDARHLDHELATLAGMGAVLLLSGDPDYPTLLAETGDAPLVLVVRGDPALLGRPQVAMVGARDASAPGLRLAHDIAGALSQKGWGVTSGLARGIDTAAHRGTLTAGGHTVAVLGGGIDHIYPPENASLFDEIAHTGALVSEAPTGTAPTAAHFPRRNRIIAGLARFTLIVEAAKQSGSLITARYAADYGREVGAVPGHPSDPRSAGPNHLLKEGAHVIETADDILRLIEGPAPLPLFAGQRTERPAPKAHPARAVAAPTATETPHEAVYRVLSTTPVTVDELVRLTGLSETALATALTDLELADRIDRLPGARVARR
jgi:DNA processing protein